MLRPPSFFKPSAPQEERQTRSLIPLPSDNNETQTPRENATGLKEQVNTLTLELNQCELKYSIQIRRLNEQITELLTEIQSLKKLQNEKEIMFSNEKIELEIQNTKRLNGFHEENEVAITRMHELQSLLSEQEREKQEMEQSYYQEKEENSRLKQSIGSIISYPDREVKYKNTITELNTQLEYGCNQIQFLHLRLEALQDILKLQERNLSQNTDDNVRGLLTTWREKVFELLMRGKVNQIETESLAKQFDLESKEFKEKAAHLQNESELQKLCISEKTAQVAFLSEDITIINGKNLQLSGSINLHQNLANQYKNLNENSLSKLTHFSHQLDNFSDKQIGIISLLQHRIAFMTDRVGFLVEYLRHSQSSLKPTRELAVQTSFPDSVLTHVHTNNETILSLTRGTLVNEIQLLVRERTILRNKLRENSEISKRELKQLKEDYFSEKEGLLNQIEQISVENRQLSRENSSFRNDLEKLQESSRDTELKIVELKSTLVETNRQHELDRNLLIQDLQDKHSESLNELENRLAEVHENYKDLQGQLNTAQIKAREEKELALGNLKLEKQDLNRRLEEMRLHLQAVEAEKNILSLTIQTMTSSQKPMQPSIQVPLENHQAKSVIEFSPQIPEFSNTAINTPRDEQNTFEANETCSSPMHRVPASELVSMVQELAQLSTQVFSL